MGEDDFTALDRMPAEVDGVVGTALGGDFRHYSGWDWSQPLVFLVFVERADGLWVRFGVDFREYRGASSRDEFESLVLSRLSGEMGWNSDGGGSGVV